jgi:hypothetical protein
MAATVPVVKSRSIVERLQVAVLAFVGLAGLPAFSPYIGAGLDSSWVIAVSLAAHRHMPFGRSLIFSYGPLGFLATPAFVVPAMGVVSMWLRIGLALLLGWLIARSVLAVAPMWATAIVTVASVWALGGAFALGGEAVLIPLVLLIGGLIDFLATATSPMSPILVTSFGALAGTMLLIKFDTGVWGLLILVATLVLHGRAVRLGLSGSVQRVGLAIAGFVGAVLIWWGALRQPIGSLGPWLHGSAEVLQGYDRAMVANGGLWWELPAALVACAVAGLLSWLLTPAGRRSYVCVLLGGAAWLFTKQSFIRHDNGHVVRIFALLAFSLLLLLGTRHRSANQVFLSTISDTGASRPLVDVTSRTSSAVPNFTERIWSISMVTVVACLAMVFHLTTYGRLQRVLPDTGMIPRAVGWLNNADQIELNREGLLKNLNIGSTLRKELLRGSLHIEPSETSVVLGLPMVTWNPLPVPQSYSAYTPWLDQKNASALASPDGPDQVLYEASSIDGRVGRFESPAAMVSLVCHYHAAYIDKRWTLFRRNVEGTQTATANPKLPGAESDTAMAEPKTAVANPKAKTNATSKGLAPSNACEGPTIELKSLIGRFGQRLDLDIEGLDDYLIVGRFDGFEVTNQTRLQELATRPAQFWFRIGDKRSGSPGRFVPATAGAPHILSMPACLRNKLGSFDSGLFTNFAVFDAPPKSKRANSKDRAQYRVRLEALPFKCPA